MLTKTDIEKYFLAEKQLGLTFLIIGIIGLALAIVCLLVWKTDLFKGAAIPLIVLGLVELFAGLGVYKKSDGDRIRNVYAYDMNPQELRDVELPRLQKVNVRFTILKVVELVLIVVSIIGLWYVKTRSGSSLWQGVFIALGIQATLFLAADLSASARARQYQQKLEAFVQQQR